MSKRWTELGERKYTAHDILEARRAERQRFRAIVRTLRAKWYVEFREIFDEVLKSESESWKKSQS